MPAAILPRHVTKLTCNQLEKEAPAGGTFDTHTGWKLNHPPKSKCNLNMDDGRSLGLMIRGGAEYGLAIYITGVDPGSAADACALKVFWTDEMMVTLDGPDGWARGWISNKHRAPLPLSDSKVEVGSDLNPSSSDLNPSSPDLNPSSSDLNPSSPDLNPSSPDLNPSSPDLNPSSSDLNPSSPDLNPSSSDLNPSSPDLNPSSPDLNPSSPDLNPIEN
ncbi:hypothetical protein NQZ68_008667 [Dissostichus eleginoides]|nr:hypothetical protein NQZ68_008667 [Dissostichus eleginoides]